MYELLLSDTHFYVMSEEIPKANQRIKKIIDQKANGNVLAFVNLFTEEEKKVVYQQRIDRMIKKGESGKWPTVPQDVLEMILKKFPDIDAHWLVTGEEKSGAVTLPDSKLLTQLKTEIDAVSLSLQRLTATLPKPADPGTNVSGAPGFAKVTSGKKEKKRRP